MLPDTNFNFSNSTDVSTLTSTSTSTRTATSWSSLIPGHAYVTISSNLPDPHDATYPDPWMTATGAELVSLNSARRAETTMSDGMSMNTTLPTITSAMSTTEPPAGAVTTSTASSNLTTLLTTNTASFDGLPTTSSPLFPSANTSTQSLSLPFTDTSLFDFTTVTIKLSTSDKAAAPMLTAAPYPSTFTNSSRSGPPPLSSFISQSLVKSPTTTTLVGTPVQVSSISSTTKKPNTLGGFGTATEGPGYATPLPTENVIQARHVTEPRLQLLHPHVSTSLVIWLVATIFLGLACYTYGTSLCRTARGWLGNDANEALPSYTSKPPTSGPKKAFSIAGRSSREEARFASGKESASEDGRIPSPHQRQHSRPCEDNV